MDFEELASIVALNSHTKNKSGVDENGRVFSQWIRSLGYQLTRYPRENIGDHLHFSAPERPGRRILLLGHLDTVFPPGRFELFEEDEQWVYGPGVCDMKGGNWIALNALRRLHKQYGEIHNIDMLLVSDEETGSDDSKALTAELVKNYDACLVFEAAGANNEVVVARKGIGTIYLDFTGKAAHAGNHYSDGCDANLAAARMLIELVALTDIERGTTVNVGDMSGGIGANTVSPNALLVAEFRFARKDERDRILGAVDRLLNTLFVPGVSVTLSGGVQRDVMEPSPDQQRLLRDIERILGYALPKELRGGVSDANVASAAGVPTLDGFGPVGDGDHTIYERANKASFVSRTEEVTAILSGLVMEESSENSVAVRSQRDGLARCSS